MITYTILYQLINSGLVCDVLYDMNFQKIVTNQGQEKFDELDHHHIKPAARGNFEQQDFDELVKLCQCFTLENFSPQKILTASSKVTSHTVSPGT